MCEESAKTVNHLFLHCSIATQVYILKCFGIELFMPRSTSDFLKCWSRGLQKVMKEIEGFLKDKPSLCLIWWNINYVPTCPTQVGNNMVSKNKVPSRCGNSTVTGDWGTE